MPALWMRPELEARKCYQPLRVETLDSTIFSRRDECPIDALSRVVELQKEIAIPKLEATLNKTQLLATLYKIRSNPTYQEAETTRRRLGNVSAMARAEKNSPEYGAISLLINTWETISLLILQVKDKDLIFEITPVLYMFTELSDAIDVIGEDLPYYAANFRLVSKQQLEWLRFKDDRYQTGEKGGMHALFG